MTGEQYAEMNFPTAGMSLVNGYGDQRPRQLPTGEWARTSRLGTNVRTYESGAQRKRGGSRPGLRKYVPAAVVAGWLVQGLAVVVGEGFTPPGGTVQLSQSGRVVTLVAVSQGNVYAAAAGATSWTAATNTTGNTPPLNFTGQVFSTSLNQKLWFADGSNWVTYDPSTNTVSRWSASAGTLPVDSKNNTPRLICTWRGRIVLSGLVEDPQNWFMSAVSGVDGGGPTNFDYTGASLVQQVAGGGTVTSQSPAIAVSGNNSPVGIVGDVITALVPFSDDVLVFGGDHTIYVASGDPMAGGQISLVSDQIGFAWGRAFVKAPDGTLFFFSNRTGIYAWQLGAPPQRISQQIEQLVNAVDTGANTITMLWNDRFQGFHVFITPTVAPGATTHLFYELRTGGWWQDTFATTAHNPIAGVTFDGNLATDRVVLIGGWDGYVRSIDPAATSDDGTPIASEVLIGPIVTKNLDMLLLKALQAVLGETSGQVTYQVYVGTSAEKALSNAAVTSGTWSAGRNLSNLVRWSGHAIYIRVTSTNQWALEQIRAAVAGRGKVQARGA